jgi:hypothetical protein
VEILNFYLGRPNITKPTDAQVKSAVRNAKGLPPWPAAEAVFEDDGVITVLLEPYREGVSVTWKRD